MRIARQAGIVWPCRPRLGRPEQRLQLGEHLARAQGPAGGQRQLDAARTEVADRLRQRVLAGSPLRPRQRQADGCPQLFGGAEQPSGLC